MTIAADIKRATAELRERDPRWVVVKRLIVMQPVTHWLCGVYLRPSNWTKGRFYLSPAIHVLAVPSRGVRPGMEPTTGSEVRAPVERGAPEPSWNLAWPNCGTLLADVVLNDLLPRIEAAKTPDGMLSYLKRTQLKFVIARQGAFNYALAGRRSEAKDLARILVEDRLESENTRRRCERFIRILDSGQGPTNRLLRRLERMYADRYGVGKWWRWEPLVDA